MKRKKNNKRNQSIHKIFLIFSIGVITVASIVFIKHSFPSVLGTQTNQITEENSKPGTTDWLVKNPAPHGEIQAYLGADSVNGGENISLYVSTKEAGDGYTFDLYRLGYYGGKGGRLMWEIPGYKGKQQGYYDMSENKSYPVNCPTCIVSLTDEKGQETYITDANWKVTNIIPTKGFVSGMYLVKLTETNHGYQWEVPFVVRDDSRKADLVYQVPFNTDQAYNIWGGTNLYNNYRLYPSNGTGNSPSWAFYASFNRPYEHLWGTGYLFNWTYPMLRFIEQQGYDVSYATNNSVTLGQTSLPNYKGFISAGHDEYWNLLERQKLEQAIKNGLNVAFFGGNDMYWQIRNLPDTKGNANRYIVEYKDYSNPHPYDPYNISGNSNQYLTTTLFRASPLNNPEDKVLKSMYGAGSYGTYQNFIVTNTTNWIYKGTSLKDGDTIPGILGLEVETFYPDNSITSNDHLTIIGKSRFTPQTGSSITAYSVLDELSTGGNIIFNAGTINWPVGIADYHLSSVIPQSQDLRIMTNNILYRMATGASPTTVSNNNASLTSFSSSSFGQSVDTSSKGDDENLGTPTTSQQLEKLSNPTSTPHITIKPTVTSVHSQTNISSAKSTTSVSNKQAQPSQANPGSENIVYPTPLQKKDYSISDLIISPIVELNNTISHSVSSFVLHLFGIK